MTAAAAAPAPRGRRGRPPCPISAPSPGRRPAAAPAVAAAEPWLTPEGIAVKPAFTAEDIAGVDFIDGWPGLPPFVRGPYPTMYVEQPWTIRQYAGFSTAEDSNAFYRRNLAAGQRGLSVAFDLPTHRGYDSDDPRVAGDVGMAGVAIDSIYDMRTLFDGIPLDKISVSMTMNGAVLPVMALYIVAAEEHGIGPEKLAGTIQNDVLKEFMVRNTFIYPPGPSMRIVADIIAYTAATDAEVQFDLGVRLSHAGSRGDRRPRARLHPRRRARIYPRRCAMPASTVDAFAPRVSFFFGIGMNFFMEVAKLRAARLLWAKLMKERFAPKDEKSLMLRVHCQTSGWSLAAQDVFNNVIRTTDRGDGGDAGAHPVAPHQRARRGAGAAHRLLGADRPQHPALPAEGIRHHADHRSVGRLVPCRAADLRARHAGRSTHIAEIDALGGMAKAIEDGLPKLRIEEAAARTQARIDSGRQTLVGVNRYRARRGAAARHPPRRQFGGARGAGRQAQAAPRRARRRRRRKPRSPR